MRSFNAYTLDNWPRRKSAEVIFENTNQAIYYANLVEDRLAAYDLLKKWRRNVQQEIVSIRDKKTFNFNRLFDLAVRGQLFRECMEEIQRLNEADR